MDNLIYNWLLSNCNNTELIDSILILSINGLYISKDTLINYCSCSNNSFGFNDKQIQILNNNIDHLMSSSLLYKDCSNIILNKNKQTKFDCSIFIINENNIKYKKENINNYSIVSYGNRKVSKYNDKSFFRIWRSLIIRNEIIFHIRLFNVHFNRIIKTGDLNQLSNYKFKSYLHSIELGTCSNDNGNENVNNYEILNSNSLPFGLSSIVLYKNYYIRSLPLSVTSIIFKNDDFNQSFEGNWLPSSLKYLELGRFYQQSIKIGQLPQSLTSLILDKSYKGSIEPGSIPSSVNTLDYVFNSNENKNKITFNSIPWYCTSLEFDSSFNQEIKVDDIPMNVTSLKFGNVSDGVIEPNALPDSLKSLVFGFASSFEIQTNTLPKGGLEYIQFGQYFDKPITSDLIPKSVVSIKFGAQFNQVIPYGLFLNHNRLKSLEFGYVFNQTIPSNSLPFGLLSLNLGGYNRELNKITFPPLLQSLSIGLRFNRVIKAGDLPQSITSLTLGRSFNQRILPGSLPSSLKSLYIECPEFNQDLTVEGCLPSSLEHIYVQCSNNLDFLNNLNFNFFSKYIRLIQKDN